MSYEHLCGIAISIRSNLNRWTAFRNIDPLIFRNFDRSDFQFRSIWFFEISKNQWIEIVLYWNCNPTSATVDCCLRYLLFLIDWFAHFFRIFLKSSPWFVESGNTYLMASALRFLRQKFHWNSMARPASFLNRGNVQIENNISVLHISVPNRYTLISCCTLFSSLTCWECSKLLLFLVKSYWHAVWMCRNPPRKIISIGYPIRFDYLLPSTFSNVVTAKDWYSPIPN